MNTDVVTFLYHEVSDDPNSTGFIRKSNLPYKHKSKEFIENIEAIKESQITPTTINQIENKSAYGYLLLNFQGKGFTEIQSFRYIIHSRSGIDQAHPQHHLIVKDGGDQQRLSGFHYFMGNVLVDLVQFFLAVILLDGIVPKIDDR